MKYSDFVLQTPATQFVGVMVRLEFMHRHCPYIVPNYPLIGAMMLTLGIRQQDIDSGKYIEEVSDVRNLVEDAFNSFTAADGRKWDGRILNQAEIAANVDKWCKLEEHWFVEDDGSDGDYHGLATITKGAK
jgi:hypothetical protein